MRRLTGLDALRGVAALMVFVHHVSLPGLHSATLGMDAGVLIFFSLSGYLLYAPFVRARESGAPIDLRGYAVRRAARILPAYLAAAFVIAAVWYPWLLGDPIGIALGTATPILVVWTLQIEAEFYVALPVLAWLVGRVTERQRIVALVVLGGIGIGATVAIMAVSVATLGFVPGGELLTIATFVWAFVPGMVVAEVEHRRRLVAPISIAVPALGLLLIGASVVVDLPSFLDLPAAIGSAMLIATVISRPQLNGRLARASVAVGALSYPVYLWHEQVIDLVEPSTWGGALVALAITIGLAVVSYVVIERPAIRLGRRLVRVGQRGSGPLEGVPIGSAPGLAAVRVPVLAIPDLPPGATPGG